jgi:hypothetical protein
MGGTAPIGGDVAEREPRRLARALAGVAGALWLATLILLAVVLPAAGWWLTCAWAAVGGAVVVAARVVPSPVGIAAAVMLLVPCVLLSTFGGLFFVPAVLALVGVAVAEAAAGGR